MRGAVSRVPMGGAASRVPMGGAASREGHSPPPGRTPAS